MIFPGSGLDFIRTGKADPHGSISQTPEAGIILFVQNPKKPTP
jgi:hypothetical protein